MPSRFAWKNWKAPCALVFILAVIITALFFAPPLVPLPAPKPYDRNQDIIFHLKHSQQIPSLTSTDLYRFREIHREHIVPPADIVQAEAFLKQIVSL